MYVSPNIVPGIPVHFAIDNCDFKNDTFDGKTNSILQHKLSFKSLTIVVCNITYQSIEGPKSLKVTPSAPRKLQNRQFWTRSFQILMEEFLALSKMITATLIEHGPYVK